MLNYLLFWTILGFIFQFYIIFGTNLLTGGPTQIAVFCPFPCFEGKEYQTESKRNKTFGNVIFSPNVIQRTWSGRQATNEAAIRQGGAPTPLGVPSTLVGPSKLHRPTSSSYIYSYTPKTSRSTTNPYFHRRNLLYPRDPILGHVPELHRKRVFITEGFYIILAPPMKCE